MRFEFTLGPTGPPRPGAADPRSDLGHAQRRTASRVPLPGPAVSAKTPAAPDPAAETGPAILGSRPTTTPRPGGTHA
jgi:hypothetical protein